jgi:predicted hydrocarbon binding protein
MDPDQYPDLLLEPDKGQLSLGGTRYMFIRPATLAALGEAAGDRAGEIFYRAGQGGGRQAAAEYLKRCNGDVPQTLELMFKSGARIGWGVMELALWDPEARVLEVSVTNSPLVWDKGQGCQILAGIMAGLGEVIWDGPVSSREIACSAQGSPACRFRVEAVK